MSKPDHQMFIAGPFTIYSHDYDGDVLTIVKDEPDPAKPGHNKGFAIYESDLVKALERLHADEDEHVVMVNLWTGETL